MSPPWVARQIESGHHLSALHSRLVPNKFDPDAVSEMRGSSFLWSLYSGFPIQDPLDIGSLVRVNISIK